MKKWEMPYTPDPKFSKRVAYMSMEFAIDQSLKIYSGGLGFLAGSHMRSAYQLKQNMIGIGMLWKFGYYDQVKNSRRFMEAKFRKKYYTFLEDTGIIVPVYIKGYQVLVKAMYLKPEIFGTVPMYLLTTDFPENDELSRSITTRLYHPNDATRVAQSVVLGIGGAKVVDELGGADIIHINEAHALPAAFHLYHKYEDIEEVKKKLVFTTHTPEKAGNSVRSVHLLHEMGFFNETPMASAQHITQNFNEQFEYTPAALRLSKISNGVSKLHGKVAKKMWEDYKGVSDIISITNAQDQEFWQDSILKKALDENDNELLVRRKKELKKELFKLVADEEGDLFDENVLTIVWARRFAGYKRADLIMRDLERFYKLVRNTDMKVQIIWAGKPYPEDMNGISQINHIYDMTYKDPNICVLTGYELSLSKKLKLGADIWLNNPRRPQEASGTSGMTAAMNAAVNISTDDGWIPEFARDGLNSFVIPPADLEKDIIAQDEHDHKHLMDIIENKVLPMYYDHPDKWVEIMKNSMKDVVPYFDSKRMAREYYERMYNYES